MKLFKFLITPWGLYLTCILAFILFLIVGVPLLSSGFNDVGERPFILIAYAVDFFIYSMLTITIIVPIFYRQWARKYWYIIAALFLLLMYVIFGTLILNNKL
jgi:hypothetical protein